MELWVARVHNQQTCIMTEFEAFFGQRFVSQCSKTFINKVYEMEPTNNIYSDHHENVIHLTCDELYS